MKIKEILRSDTSLLNYCIEVNGELYNERKHGDLIHIDTIIETQEYNPILNVAVWRSKIKFIAIERSKILQLLKEKDTDNSLSDFMDKRIKEIAKE